MFAGMTASEGLASFVSSANSAIQSVQDDLDGFKEDTAASLTAVSGDITNLQSYVGTSSWDSGLAQAFDSKLWKLIGTDFEHYDNVVVKHVNGAVKVMSILEQLHDLRKFVDDLDKGLEE